MARRGKIASDRYRFPESLSTKDDSFIIEAYKFIPDKFVRRGRSRRNRSAELLGGKSIGKVVLPMPSTIPDSKLPTKWGASESGIVSQIIGSIGEATVDGGIGGAFSEIGNQFTSLNEQFETSSGLDFAKNAFVRAAISQAGGSPGNFGKFTARFGGIRFDENVELAFDGMELRPAFDFEFILNAKSSSESNLIRKIVRFLKKSSTPSRGPGSGKKSSIFVQVPNIFKISYRHEEKTHKFMNIFKPCAITNIQVNGHSGGYMTYWDGAPIQVRLKIDFQELTPIYREDFDTKFGKEGYGY